ncbi:hypothetical protein CC1G_12916 [Coprinopsis cinerea okayama7|uniref:Uncharacterized protein n=1 Tax=Coprinopsis cinerea (strain Okayama-7 / 130 / ATCC MYA-4618 / FGSC 9003) TaxID=240176 RepID=A8P9M1_COPC7|nr:hypothetical protein CC1G_12916 [Coprinopsis cinerea okayama7\|eukprot:XP_001839799.1 hypothetical protein CC1G_12916 [Coprinopsis cinerea okayama7\
MSFPENQPIFPPGLPHPPPNGGPDQIQNAAVPYSHAFLAPYPQVNHTSQAASGQQIGVSVNAQPMSYIQSVGLGNGAVPIASAGQVYPATAPLNGNTTASAVVPSAQRIIQPGTIVTGATLGTSANTAGYGLNVRPVNGSPGLATSVGAGNVYQKGVVGNDRPVATYATAIAAQNNAAQAVPLANSVPPPPPASAVGSTNPSTQGTNQTNNYGRVQPSSKPCRVSVEDYLTRPDYLPTGALLGGSAWTQVGNFNWYSISGTNEKVVMTVIGKVSRNRLNVDPNGTYNGKHPLKKAKFGFTLVVPDQSNPFHAHFQQAIAFLTQLQAAIAQSNDQRYLLVQDNGQMGLRLSQDMFAEREEPLNPHVYDLTVNWPMDPQYRNELLANAPHVEVKPLMAYDYSDVLLAPERVKWALAGALVEATFTLRHCVVNDVALHDVFTGGLLQVRVLEEGSREVNPFRANPGGGPVLEPVHGMVNGQFMPAITGHVLQSGGHRVQPPLALPLQPGSQLAHPLTVNQTAMLQYYPTATAFQHHPAPSLNPGMYYSPATGVNEAQVYPTLVSMAGAQGHPLYASASHVQPSSTATEGGNGSTPGEVALAQTALGGNRVTVPRHDGVSVMSTKLPAAVAATPSSQVSNDGRASASQEASPSSVDPEANSVPPNDVARTPDGTQIVKTCAQVTTPLRPQASPWIANGYLPTPQTPSTWRPPSQLDAQARSLYGGQTKRGAADGVAAGNAEQSVISCSISNATSSTRDSRSGISGGPCAAAKQPTDTSSLLPALPVQSINNSNAGSLFHTTHSRDQNGASSSTTAGVETPTSATDVNANVAGKGGDALVPRVPTGPVEPLVDKGKGKGKGKRPVEDGEDTEPPARRTRQNTATGA